VQFLVRAGDFIFSIAFIPALGLSQHLSEWVLGFVSPGVKWLARGADP
jgi:hypothetical protein